MRLFFAMIFVPLCLFAADSPQWGNGYTHNNVSCETDLPTEFDVSQKVRFAVPIGKTNYAPPIIANGRILIGTNDASAYCPVLTGDRGVLLCFDEKTGEFLWKLALPKYTEKRFFDYPNTGIISPPTVLENRAYLVSNRGEILCLDLNGLKDGNNGPFQNEAKLMSDPDAPLYSLTEKDADIIWVYDMISGQGVRQHDAANASIVIHDGILYLNTTNGLNAQYTAIECPEAPALLALDMETGEPLARDDFWVGGNTVHGQWSSPSIGEIDGISYVFFGGGNAMLYAFKALNRESLRSDKSLHKIQPLWTYNGQPIDAPPYRVGRNSPSFTCNAPPVFSGGKVYAVFGHDGWLGQRPRISQIVCLDAKDGSMQWTSEMIPDGVLAPPTISDGFVYIADRKGNLHCRNAETGAVIKTINLKGDNWGAPLVADGKIFLGSERKAVFVLDQQAFELIAEIPVPAPIFSPIVAANKTLFFATANTLYAISISGL